jgi:hypothetical protein
MNLSYVIKWCSIAAAAVVISPLIYLYPAFAGKVPDGIYGEETGTDGILEVRGNQQRTSNLDGTFPWKSSSNLVVVKKGVIQDKTNRRFYYCLISMLPDKGRSGKAYKCTKSGWGLVR